jgi:hypothetical protein
MVPEIRVKYNNHGGIDECVYVHPDYKLIDLHKEMFIYGLSFEYKVGNAPHVTLTICAKITEIRD